MLIKFDWDKPEDKGTIRQMLAWEDKYPVVEELYNKCRSQLKHGEFKTIEEAEAFIEDVRITLYDIVYSGE